jgi:hypothetical protein
MKGFSPETKNALGHYVYVLIDPRDSKIFYVGKGEGNRVFAHLNCALDSDYKNAKYETIREIVKAGMQIRHYIIRHNLKDDKQALLVESVLIDLFTYKDFNLITNITNIVAGHDQRELGIKTVEELEAQYAAKPLDIENIKHKLLSININRKYKERISIYDVTRASWKLSPEKANQCDFVVSEYQGVIRAIYKVNERGWQFDVNTNRYFFEGEEVMNEKILNLYLNKRIEKARGAQYPIRYLGF